MNTFTGTISKGKEVLDAPHRYAVHKATLEGQKIEIILRKRTKQRSNPQNNAYWGIAVKILSNHTGFSEEEIHEALKQKFASRVDPDTGLTIVESTAKMDTARFNKYYEDVQRWASEFLGCYIPDPGEF